MNSIKLIIANHNLSMNLDADGVIINTAESTMNFFTKLILNAAVFNTTYNIQSPMSEENRSGLELKKIRSPCKEVPQFFIHLDRESLVSTRRSEITRKASFYTRSANIVIRKKIKWP